jgi:hypothetical protein
MGPAAAGLRASIGAPLSPYERAAFERALDAVRAPLGAGTFDARWTSAQAAPWEQSVDGVAAFGELLRRHGLGRRQTQEEPAEHAAMAR